MVQKYVSLSCVQSKIRISLEEYKVESSNLRRYQVLETDFSKVGAARSRTVQKGRIGMRSQ